ncbi:MAG: DUF814 domain-containing protein [Bacteroidia bacterium]|nr:DUF814 domain-containing protein [Bacteroidia bacterium]
MHIHHYTLVQLADFIRAHLLGGEVVECFTQEKNELVIGLGAPDFQLFLKVKCGGPLPYIWPQDEYHKARKNVLPLFQDVVGYPLTHVRVVPYERVLILQFGQRDLVLKMHGIQSNVLYREQRTVKSIFRNNLELDWDFVEKGGQWQADQEVDPVDLAASLREICPVLDGNFAERLDRLIDAGESPQKALDDTVDVAQTEGYFLRKKKSKIQFLLFDPLDGQSFPLEGNIKEGLDLFLRAWSLQYFYEKQYDEARKSLEAPVKKLEGQIARYRESIELIENSRSSEEIGSLLMANLHALKPNQEKVELFDFYTNGQIEIKLDPRLNPQKNAERYFLKQKKRKSQVKHLLIQIGQLEEELFPKMELLEEFEALPRPADLALSGEGVDITPMKSLRKFRKSFADELEAGKKGGKNQKSPFLEFEKDGYLIWVGRNAKNNDQLTLHQARKEDIWLHAKDVTGSHVVVRNPQGKPLPKPVLEFAAALAAFFSKRKTDTLVPVSYTPRKHVRKRKGDAAGAVVVDREQVILVEPKREG